MRIREEEVLPLTAERCRPVRGMVAPLSHGEAETLLRRLSPGWRIDNKGRVVKEYFFKNFAEALEFVNRIGELSEHEHHHPELLLAWGLVRVTMWTHKIGGLQKSDFILAAKIDEIPHKKAAEPEVA